MIGKIVFAAAGRVFVVTAALLLAAALVPAQGEVAINAIQGKGNISAMNGREVRTQGIVTAVTRTGFFIQTPDDKADADPLTSEGVFVFTREAPPANAAPGAMVVVTGLVEEFRPRTEPNTLTLTEISMRTGRDEVRVVSRGNALPKPVAITVADMHPNRIDQLEKYEGMRVTVPAMTVVAPTGGRVEAKTASATSNGTFFGVLKGVARPFREPGLDIFQYVFLGEKEQEKLRAEFPKISIWDGNPERIRVESTGQADAKPIDVSTFQEIADLTGVLHFAYRAYTILVDPDSKHTIRGSFSPAGIPTLEADQFSIAATNIENFFDDVDDPGIDEDVVDAKAFAARLSKISLAVRNSLLLPDVISVNEAENLNVLKKLAGRINADETAAGRPDPKYDAFLVEGNDPRGIDNGFLVKTSRVKVLEVKQFGKDEKYKHPVSGDNIHLNDRPPLMLRVSVPNPRGGVFEFTAISNHLKSFNGYNDERQQSNVRTKKRLQAEYLARLVQERQKANSGERVVVLGDMNMFQFNDGILDMLGTIAGKPAAKGTVLLDSQDLVDPDLVNLVDLIAPTERYSYLFDGNAQVLDHIIVNQAFRPAVLGYGYIRLNADHPEVMRNDAARPERYSDHDPAIAFFSIK